MGEVNLNPSFLVEFQLSLLEKKYEKKEIQEILHEQLSTIVPEKCILGFQLIPWYAPNKVEIECSDRQTVDELVHKGVDIGTQHIDLAELGYGALRVTVQDAPLDFPNDQIIKWLSQYGDVSGFRHEHYTNKKTGKKTNWKVGARVGLIKLHSFEWFHFELR